MIFVAAKFGPFDTVEEAEAIIEEVSSIYRETLTAYKIGEYGQPIELAGVMDPNEEER